ncbi:hypothetical protein [Pontivivens ytuae]|uniref:ASCH domain-containing protein n=1 Tax=Pontivivens ytuae TaxID=2789856 RepID=A0A7S9LT28_9RHOB|nr:hypothetical protein [Pontivivens ytuae]QPH54210.1 hypothetical protein I0K15_00075 [Pontivivens ytuae]
MSGLPPLALSVRQPWAWAIIHGGKVIENRSLGAIKSGNMDCRRICIHAATGLKRSEYDWGLWRLHRHGVTAPRPEDLPRGAIIGTVDVVDIISESDSEWFGGPWGLVLENPAPVEPIPAVGELGYFAWERSGELAAPLPWMFGYDRPNGDSRTLSLFDDLPPSFAEAPERPGRKRS